MNTQKFATIRADQFPITERYAYLDTATTGPFATSTRNAMVGYIDNRYREGMDIPDYLENWNLAEKLRYTVAAVLNADAGEIFFSGSGSDMINVFSRGIELKENANVVTTDLSFPSTPYTWMNRVGQGNVKNAVSRNGQVPAKALFDLVDDNTAVISLCLVENTSGFRHDIGKIGEFCQQRGIYLVLDVTQCIGALNVDVKNTHIDYLIATTYKWLNAPFGISFAYASKRVLDRIRPTFVGWTGTKDRHNHSRFKLEMTEGANRFETGNLNWLGLTAIDQSMAMYLELGKDDVEQYILGLTDYVYEKIGELPDVGLVGPFPKKNRSGIVFLTFPKEWKLDDGIVRENGIRAHVTSETTMRISMHFFNNRADIDKLVAFLHSRHR